MNEKVNKNFPLESVKALTSALGLTLGVFPVFFGYFVLPLLLPLFHEGKEEKLSSKETSETLFLYLNNCLRESSDKWIVLGQFL